MFDALPKHCLNGKGRESVISVPKFTIGNALRVHTKVCNLVYSAWHKARA